MRTIKKLTVITLFIGVLAWGSLLPAWGVDVAKVNNRVITEQDINTALGGFNEGQKKQLLRDSTSKREVVSNLIEQELLIQEGEKQKLDQDQEYRNALAAFKRQYLTQRVLAKNIEPQVTTAAAKKYYAANKRVYSTDKVHVQHILVSDEKTANDILKKARAPKADFQKLAEQFSKDPSAKNNRGDIGIVTRDSPFVDEFKNAAFEGDKGEIVGPIKTLYGYHIIKVVDKKIGKTLGYEEVEMRVKADLKKALVQRYLIQLRKQSKVSINEQALNRL